MSPTLCLLAASLKKKGAGRLAVLLPAPSQHPRPHTALLAAVQKKKGTGAAGSAAAAGGTSDPPLPEGPPPSQLTQGVKVHHILLHPV